MKLTPALFLTACLLSGIAQADGNQLFHSQNHTVSCLGMGQTDENPSFVGCDIKGQFVKHKYKRDKSCHLDWGQSFSVTKTGKAQIDCVGDTYADKNSRLLKVGQTIKGDGWSCTAVSQDGIKCVNTRKKGFILQKSRQVLLN